MDRGMAVVWVIFVSLVCLSPADETVELIVKPLLIGTTGLVAAGFAVLWGIRTFMRHKKGVARNQIAPTTSLPQPETHPSAADGRHHPLYRAARIVLFLLSTGLFITSLGGIVRHVDSLFYATEMQLPRSDAELKDAVLIQLAIATATLDYDSIILQALTEKDIARAEIYANVAQRIGFTLLPGTAQRLEEATGFWASLRRGGEELFEGAWSGKVDSVESFIGAGIADFSGAGDIRDIWNHGGAWLEGKPYDEFLLGLSIFGLAVTVIDPSQVLNTGAAILKGAGRLQRVNAALLRRLRHLVASVVDKDAAKAMVRSPSPAAAARVMRREGLPELRRMATHVGTIYDTGGGRAVLMALRHADNAEEITLFARVSRVMGKQADEVIEIAGKRLKTVFRASKLSTRAATAITGWAAALIGAIIGLATSLSEMIARRIGAGIVLRHFAAYLARRQVSTG